MRVKLSQLEGILTFFPQIYAICRQILSKGMATTKSCVPCLQNAVQIGVVTGSKPGQKTSAIEQLSPGEDQHLEKTGSSTGADLFRRNCQHQSCRHRLFILQGPVEELEGQDAQHQGLLRDLPPRPDSEAL